MDIRTELTNLFPQKLVDALLDAYREIEKAFDLSKWKASELDAGHFVEASRRIIEHQLFGKYTAIGKSLPSFSDSELKKYEQASGDESYRILLPRALKSIYNVRNKRGVGHLGKVSPNEMDSTYILYTTKWILAEFLRIASGSDPEVVQSAISNIVERRIGVIWKHENIVRILHPKCSARDQALVHLYDTSPQPLQQLQDRVEYQNRSDFRKILLRLHKARLIEMNSTEQCHITPLGQTEAEKIIMTLQG